ncbi:MAG: sulfotransferase [Vicinamibacteria bacterium]
MLAALHKSYRRIRYGDPIVVVSGLPRSGTSMLMKMLEAGGLEIVHDGVRTADEDNPRGYYEHERIKNLAREKDQAWLGEARGKAMKVISTLLKELPGNRNYKVLFIRREMSEVLASQKKMLERRGEASNTSDEQMAEFFESDVWRAGYLLKRAPQFEVLYLNYRDVVEHPKAAAERISAFLGRPLDPDVMSGVVDKQLYRNRAGAGT